MTRLQRRLWHLLCFLARRRGFAFPSRAWLARKLGVCARTISRCIRALTLAGLLSVTRTSRSSRYHVSRQMSSQAPLSTAPKPASQADSRPPPPPPSTRAYGGDQKPEGVSLRNVTEKDLRDDARLTQLHHEAVARGLIAPGDRDRLDFWAAAAHALRIGRQKPRLFSWCVRHWNRARTFIAGIDEDAARRRLRPPRRRDIMAEVLETDG